MRPLLIDGLSQAGVDCMVPNVSVHRNLWDVLNGELGSSIHTHSIRMIAHPPLQTGRAGDMGRVPRSGEVHDAVETSIGEGVKRWVRAEDSLRFSQYTAQLQQDILSSAMSGSGTTSPSSSSSHASQPQSVLLAVGPEGGWVPDEVRAFQRRGFQLVNLGPRILRTDIAVSTGCL
jgi:hypothetical protein